MTSNDEIEFLSLMNQVGNLYGKAINEALFEIYWKTLEPFDFAAVKRAFQSHIKNPDAGQYMPKPADIFRYLEGTSQTRALTAWSQVIEAIRRVGSYNSVVFDDHLIHTVINDMGGWERICSMTEKELPFRAQEFEKRYAGLVLDPPAQYASHLAGTFEQHNLTHGYEVAPPFLIGNQQKALLVHESGKSPRLACLSIAPLNEIVEKLPMIPHYLENSDEKK